MSIINAKNVTPKSIRSVMPSEYKTMPYNEIHKGDVITITSCVFSVYQARDKDREPIDGVYNCTLYLGLDDGSYTSLKGETVIGQLTALTNFSHENEPGQYYFNFEPEKCTVITVSEKRGSKTFDYLALEQ